MKNCILLTWVLLVFGLPGCKPSCANQNKEQILRIGTNANFPPFEFINEKGKLQGFDIDFGHALAQKLEKRAKFKEYDFDALILALNKNQVDIILSGISITAARQAEITLIPYQGKPLKQIGLLFWKKAPPKNSSLQDIKKHIINYSHKKARYITVQAGHFLEKFLKNNNLPLKPLAGPPEQLLDLKYKKSAVAALDIDNARVLEKKHKNLKLIIFDLPKYQWDLGNGIGIKKEKIKLAQDIKQAVEKLSQDGTIQELTDKWLKGN